MTPIDPHQVAFTGENSFLRLKVDADGVETTTCAHWRALYSPHGPGHVLFVRSDATDGRIKVYSDNVEFARWAQILEGVVNRKPFADPSLPVVSARFSRTGDSCAGYSEIAESAEGRVVLSWREIGAPYIFRVEPNNPMTGPWGVYSCLIPARAASLSVNGRSAAGATYPEAMAGHPSSMSCIAWSETWLT
ncbi:MAG: hypothetical protein EXQ99_05920 [Alphaproteobacteria bacterium]|nr:hypothetical protein [Alphaproteobacteria bacterium]